MKNKHIKATDYSETKDKSIIIWFFFDKKFIKLLGKYSIKLIIGI